MYSYRNDYSVGCHPNILEALSKTNLEQLDGYGDDIYSVQAKKLIKKKINNPKAAIYFVSGGTQANTVIIASILKPFESVISAHTAHINVHEAGAIESTGHKIEIVNSKDGKLTVADVKSVTDKFEDHHMTRPKIVYISNSTESGTIYKKQELEELSTFCKSKNLYLFLDGARLGSALAAEDNDVTLADISKLTDVFYIGGTKNGALIGEAIVINNENLQPDFNFHLKQRGALMAKGRLIGIQFAELFKEELFFTLAKQANKMAMKLADAFRQKGYSFLTESTSNQIFPILPNTVIQELSKNYGFYIWRKIDSETSAIRLVTSWATNEADVDTFIKSI